MYSRAASTDGRRASAVCSAFLPACCSASLFHYAHVRRRAGDIHDRRRQAGLLSHDVIQEELIDLAMVQDGAYLEPSRRTGCRKLKTAGHRCDQEQVFWWVPKRTRCCSRPCRSSPETASGDSDTNHPPELWRSIRFPYWSTGSALKKRSGNEKVSLIALARGEDHTRPAASVTRNSTQL
jgi:hypothetical protein